MLKFFQAWSILVALSHSPEAVAVPVLTTADRLVLHHEHFLESRRESLHARSGLFRGPSVARIVEESPAPWEQSSLEWHHQISTAVFYVGAPSTGGPAGARTASAWDPDWMEHFGGLDHPHRRAGYLPEGFTPRRNPFYFALPYNDLDSTGQHRPEASKVIPWFGMQFKEPSLSVCRDRWIAIHHTDRVCYAQWKDVSPVSSDDWKYVFRHQQPQATRNGGAGLEVSPAVRDFLRLRNTDRVSWRFVEDHEVPEGPWTSWQTMSFTDDDRSHP